MNMIVELARASEATKAARLGAEADGSKQTTSCGGFTKKYRKTDSLVVECVPDQG
jgi:hypothetical protein